MLIPAKPGTQLAATAHPAFGCTHRGAGWPLSLRGSTQPKKSYRLAPNVDLAWATFIHLCGKGGAPRQARLIQ